MHKKDSSIPRVVSTIKIDISSDLKYSANESNNVYLFSYEPRSEKTGFLHMQNNDADQLRGNHEADQRLCFHYTDSTIPLLSKSKISSF